MGRWAVGGIALAGAAILSLSGCATPCSATAEKLASLQRGMSYQETAAIMGCSGKAQSPGRSQESQVSVVEWEGPGPDWFMSTELEFVDDKLLFYTTRSRSGF